MASASYQARIPQKFQTQLAPIVKSTALKYGVPESKVWEQIAVESGGNPNAKSPTGPVGVMQLSTAAAKDAGYTKADMYDPVKNIDAGVKKLKSDLDYFNGDWDKARLAYNQGRGKANQILSGKAEMNTEAKNYVNNPIFQAGYITKQGAATAEATPQPTTDPQKAINFATGSRSRWEAVKGAEGGFNSQYISKDNPSTNKNYWADRAKGISTGVENVTDTKDKWTDTLMKGLQSANDYQNQEQAPVQHSRQMQQLMSENQSAQMFAQQPTQAPQYNFNQSFGNPINQFQVLSNFGGPTNAY